MPREPGVYWHKHAGCYASNTGYGDDGKRKTLYFRGFAKTDKRGALAALKAYHEAREAAVTDSISPRVESLCELYLQASTRSSKPRTVEGHAEMLSKFCDFIAPGSAISYGERRAQDIKAADLSRMIRAWEDAGYSPSYRSRLVRSIKACFAWSAAADPNREPERLIPENPMKDVKGVSVPQSPKRYAERKEVADFLRFAWRRAETRTPLYRRFGRLMVLMVRMCAATGCRPGELCDAWWSDFDPDRGIIILPPGRHKTGGKTGKPRVIFIPPLLVPALLREQARDHHPTHIFTHKRGKGGEARGATAVQGEPWDSRSLSHAIRAIRKEAIAAGVQLLDSGPDAFVVYRLRHTYISNAIMGGIPSSVAAAATGTSERMIANTYGHILDSRIREATEFMVRNRPRGSGK